MSIKIHLKYSRGTTKTFPIDGDKTFADLAEKIKERIRETGEGLLPNEQDRLLKDQNSGGIGFIRSFTLMTKGEEVYPNNQHRKIKKYSENGELVLTATFHYEGGTIHR